MGNYIRNVAVVGAGGNVGRAITEALLKTGKHEVIAITRHDSQSKLPDDVTPRRIDYEQPKTIVKALRGIDALVITLSGRSKIDVIEAKLVKAAAEACVPWILPNEWSPDSTNQGLIDDLPFLFGKKAATRKLIEEIGQSSYVSICAGFWYEYSLGIANNYGFDFVKKVARFFDEGETKISTSTWPQIGRAVASLLSLPIKQDVSKSGSCLEDYKNQIVYVKSFTLNQREMLASALRVTDTREEDWTIAKHSSHEQFETGMKEFKEGKFGGANFLYSRVFFPDGTGNFEHSKGTSNDKLGLPVEDLDEATRRAIERQQAA